MAATLGTIQPDVVEDRSHLGEKLRVFPFTAVADGETWSSGIGGITRVAWESTAATDFLCAYNTGTDVIQFYTEGATSLAGNLLIWSKG